jgi:hypothetical protein
MNKVVKKVSTASMLVCSSAILVPIILMTVVGNSALGRMIVL